MGGLVNLSRNGRIGRHGFAGLDAPLRRWSRILDTTIEELFLNWEFFYIADVV